MRTISMTSSRLQQYYEVLAPTMDHLKGVDGQPLTTLVEVAIEMGLHAFWNYESWEFRFKSMTLDTSGAAASYQLDSRCVGLRVVKETSSPGGSSANWMRYEEFSRRWPDPTKFATGRPEIWTAYQDKKRWHIQLYPVPNVSSMKLEGCLSTPDDCKEVPNHGIPSLKACIDVNLGVPGKPGAMKNLIQVAEHQLQQLMRTDSPHMSTPVIMFDDTNYGGGGAWPFSSGS